MASYGPSIFKNFIAYIKGCGSKSVYYQRIGNYLKVYKFVSAPFIKHIAVPSSKLEFPFFLSLVLSCLVSPQDGL